MTRFIQLNLRSGGESADTANLAKPERPKTEFPVISRRLNRIINSAAHKAATQSRGPGIFTK